jgi:hypothetical protein
MSDTIEDVSSMPAKQPNAYKPGDNPNKLKKSGKSSYRPQKQNVKSTAYTQREFVDPKKVTQVLQPESLRNVKAPGAKVVGSIELDHDMFQNFEDLSIRVLNSARDSVLARINFPEVEPVARSLIPICFATQLYETLSLLQEDGMVYKLKSLKYGQIKLPDFMHTFFQSVGHFEAVEGIIRIEHCETHLLRLLDRAVTNFENNVHPLPGYIANIHATQETLWDTYDAKDVISDIADRFFDNLIETEFNTAIGTVCLPDFEVGDDPYLYEGNVLAVTRDIRLAAQARYFAILRNCSSYLDFVAAATISPLFEDVVGLYRSARSVRFFVEIIGWITSWCSNEFDFVFDRLFRSSVFKPSSQGTSCQFVEKPEKPEAFVGDAITANHKFDITVGEAAKGFVLLPAENVTFGPKYQIDSETNRRQQFENFVKVFRVEV